MKLTDDRFEHRNTHRLLPVVSYVAALLTIPMACHALTILSGPTFTQATNAPLAGVLALTTDEASRVSVSVNDGTNTWERNFYDYSTTHAVPLLGFLPNQTNVITVTVYDRDQNPVTAAQPLVFKTDPLPSDFPPSVLITNNPALMEPGYTLFRIQNNDDMRSYVTIVDNYGRVVWYTPDALPSADDVRQLTNGDLFLPLTNEFVEINMLGDTVKTWKAPPGLPINIHDGVLTDHGTILYLSDASRVETNFPTSATDPNAPLQTTPVLYNKVVEISVTNDAVLHTWSPIDMLDPRRMTYLTFSIKTPLGLDIEHSNAILEDPSDNTLIDSMREQNAVIKFSRTTGQLKWILGPHANWGPAWQPYLLTPVGTPFEWQYGQHAPTLTPQGTLLLYDDGNYRASPPNPLVADADNYSRAVEYAIDETNMTVSQVWQYAPGVDGNPGDRLFTYAVGKVQWLPKRHNVLVTFGYVTYVNGAPPSAIAPGASMVRIQEVTHDPVPKLVFDLEFFNQKNTDPHYTGCFCYRSRRIPDLYPHPLAPAADLTLRYENGTSVLDFVADPTWTYAVQASTDLVHWQTIGLASSSQQNGVYEFKDESAGSSTARYYRVETQQN